MKGLESKTIKLTNGGTVKVKAMKILQFLEMSHSSEKINNDGGTRVSGIIANLKYIVGKQCLEPVMELNDDDFTCGENLLTFNDCVNIMEAAETLSMGEKLKKKLEKESKK